MHDRKFEDPVCDGDRAIEGERQNDHQKLQTSNAAAHRYGDLYLKYPDIPETGRRFWYTDGVIWIRVCS